VSTAKAAARRQPRPRKRKLPCRRFTLCRGGLARPLVASWLLTTHDTFFRKDILNGALRCLPSNAMTERENKTAILSSISASLGRGTLRALRRPSWRFDADCACAHDESSWKEFRDAWLGRKSGVLTQITDNWLKPATLDLKRAVGAALNELRAHVESQIEARRAAIESGAEESALAVNASTSLSLASFAHRLASPDPPGLPGN